MTHRTAIVENALWGVAHEPDIHYRQSRPIDALADPRRLPLTTDCSGFVTDCYAWAGAPDPNGLGYNGYGFTGTLLDTLAHIDLGDAQPGDLIVYGPGGGDHVVVIVELDGRDPWTVSHGRERGPARVRHSAELLAHRPPTTVLRGAGLDDDGMHMDQDVQAKFDEIDLRVIEIQTKVEHIEKMLGSAITVLNQVALDVAPHPATPSGP